MANSSNNNKPVHQQRRVPRSSKLIKATSDPNYHYVLVEKETAHNPDYMGMYDIKEDEGYERVTDDHTITGSRGFILMRKPIEEYKADLKAIEDEAKSNVAAVESKDETIKFGAPITIEQMRGAVKAEE